jgi:hypothetical protein
MTARALVIAIVLLALPAMAKAAESGASASAAAIVTAHLGDCLLPPNTRISGELADIPATIKTHLPVLAPPGSAIMTDVHLPHDPRASDVLNYALLRGDNAVVFFAHGGGIGIAPLTLLASKDSVEIHALIGQKPYLCAKVRQTLAPELVKDSSELIAAVMAPCESPKGTAWSGNLDAVPAIVRQRYPSLSPPGGTIASGDPADKSPPYRLIGTVTEGEKWFVLLEKGGQVISPVITSQCISQAGFDGIGCRWMARIGSGQR